MSGYLTGRALWTEVPKHLKLTLIAICDACNDEGLGYPGQERLAHMAMVSDRQIRSNIKELQGLELLTVSTRAGDGTGRKSNLYQVNLEKLDFPPQRGGNRKGQPEAGFRKPPHATGSGLPEADFRKGDQATGSELPEVGFQMEGGNRKFEGGQPEVQTSYERQYRTSVLEEGRTEGVEPGPVDNFPPGEHPASHPSDQSGNQFPNDGEPFAMFPDWQPTPLHQFDGLGWTDDQMALELECYRTSLLSKPGSHHDRRTQGNWSYAFLKTCLKSKARQEESRNAENQRTGAGRRNQSGTELDLDDTGWAETEIAADILG